MAHDHDSSNPGFWLLIHLLQRRKHKDGRLSKTGLGLAQDVVSENGLGNGNLLDCRAQCMLETFSKRSKRPSVVREAVLRLSREPALVVLPATPDRATLLLPIQGRHLSAESGYTRRGH